MPNYSETTQSYSLLGDNTPLKIKCIGEKFQIFPNTRPGRSVQILVGSSGWMDLPSGAPSVFEYGGSFLLRCNVPATCLITMYKDTSIFKKEQKNSKQVQYARIRAPNVSDLSSYDGRSFRQIWQVPFVGFCNVRAGFDTRDTSTGSWSAIAISSGRDIDEINPKNADGTDASWDVFTNVAYTAANASWATNGQVGGGVTGWSLQNIPAPIDGIGGGFVYGGVINSNTAGRHSMNGNVNRPSSDWQRYINPILRHMKYRSTYNSGPDNVTTNQAAYAVTDDFSYYQPLAFIDVIPSVGCKTGVFFGDSKSQAMGTGTPSVQPHNYAFPLIACNMFNEAGIKMCVANYAFEGREPTYYLKRWELLLADLSWAPDFIAVQPTSINPSGGYTKANMDPGVKETLRLAALSIARGSKVIIIGSAPDGGSNLTQDNLRKLYNAAFADTDLFYFDLDPLCSDGGSPARLIPSYTYDNTHFNKVFEDIAAAKFYDFLKVVLEI